MKSKLVFLVSLMAFSVTAVPVFAESNCGVDLISEGNSLHYGVVLNGEAYTYDTAENAALALKDLLAAKVCVTKVKNCSIQIETDRNFAHWGVAIDNSKIYTYDEHKEAIKGLNLLVDRGVCKISKSTCNIKIEDGHYGISVNNSSPYTYGPLSETLNVLRSLKDHGVCF